MNTDVPRAHVCIVVYDVDIIHTDAKDLGNDLGDYRFRTLPYFGRPGYDVDLAVVVDLDDGPAPVGFIDARGTAARAGLLDLGCAVKDPPAPEQPAGPLSEERLEAIRSRWQGIGLVTEGLPQGLRAKADVDRLLAEVDRLRTAATTVPIG